MFFEVRNLFSEYQAIRCSRVYMEDGIYYLVKDGAFYKLGNLEQAYITLDRLENVYRESGGQLFCYGFLPPPIPVWTTPIWNNKLK